MKPVSAKPKPNIFINPDLQTRRSENSVAWLGSKQNDETFIFGFLIGFLCACAMVLMINMYQREKEMENQNTVQKTSSHAMRPIPRTRFI